MAEELTKAEVVRFARLRSFPEFLNRWLRTHWQSLLVMGLGIYLPLQVFIILAVQIWKRQGGLAWDVAILNEIHAASQPSLDRFALTFTNLGTVWGVFPIAALISVGLLYRRRWRSLTYFLIATLGCALINRTGKEYLHRVRPSLWAGFPPEPGFSFPSGHAMSSMILVATLAVLLWQSRWCWLVLAIGVPFVVTIGWTRLYLGVHYPSDIVAGWMMSLAWAIGIGVLVKPNAARPIQEVIPESGQDI